MNALQQDFLFNAKKTLEDQKNGLTTQIAALSTQDPFMDPERTNDNAASDTDAAEESDHDRVGAMVDELKEKMIEIDAALGRIEDGTYGTCLECSTAIAESRLLVLPTARNCAECETKKASR